MTYPDLFRRGAQLWWRTRALWALGVLAALVGAGDYNATNFNFNSSFQSDTLPPGFEQSLEQNPLLQAVIANPLPFALGAALVGLLLFLLAIVVGPLAHGAMIHMADQADRGLESSLGASLRVGSARLLPMVLLSLLLALPALVIAVGVIVMLFLFLGSIIAAVASGSTGENPQVGGALLGVGGALLCGIPLMLLLVLLSVALNFLGRFAQRAIVLEGAGPLQGLRRSWSLVRRNFGNAILNWLALLVTGALFSFIAALPALALGIPAALAFAESGQIPWGLTTGLLIYGVAVGVLLGGWLTSFNSTLWTLVYRDSRVKEQEFAVPASYAPGD